MKNRYKKRVLYRLKRPQYVPAQALKGMLKKSSKPVSIEAMNEAIVSEIHKNWIDDDRTSELVPTDSTGQRHL